MLALHFAEVARKVLDDRDRQVLDCAGRGAANGRGDARRVVRRQHDSCCACPLGAANDRSQVARIGDGVKHRQQRRRPARELIRVGVAVRLRSGEHALVVSGTRLG